MAIMVSLGVANRVADAACVNISQNMRTSVGQLPDLVFTAGTAGTQYLNPVYFNFASGTTGFWESDCGVQATSNNAAVTLTETYGCGGSCATGTAVGVDVAESFASPLTFRYSGPDMILNGPIPVHYDGTGTAGTIVQITLQLCESDTACGTPQNIGYANVYIVSATPNTWYTTTASATNTSGSELILDNSVINGVPGAKVFVEHYSGTTSTRWNHPIAAFYDSSISRWTIRNEDGTTMPTSGLSFVVRIDPSAKTIVNSVAGTIINITDPNGNYNPYAVVIVTPFSRSTTAHMTPKFAVRYVAHDSTKGWQIISTDGTSFPVSTKLAPAGFFVKVLGGGQYLDDTMGGTDPSGVTNTYRSDDAGTDIVASATRLTGDTKLLSNFCFTTTSDELILTTFNETALMPPAAHTYFGGEEEYYGVGVTTGHTATVFKEDTGTMGTTEPINVWGQYRTDCGFLVP
ncbi:MAG TPA: hypothetical protein VGM88_13700 [Kofleriaceae bacterium]